ncbi:MAG: SpoIIE family protein phosphatase [Bacteroidales bacterium]|nr:SpoIIE family protein phosphatase [Bacteroidales bacterium]
MSQYIKILLSLIIVFLSINSFAQKSNKISDLEKKLTKTTDIKKQAAIYIELGRLYLEQKSSKCVTSCNKGIELIGKSKLNSEKADLYNILGVYYMQSNQYKKATNPFISEYQIRQNLKKPKELAVSCLNLGICYSKQSKILGGYKKSKKYLEECLELCKKNKYKDLQERALQFLSDISYNAGKYKEACDFLIENYKKQCDSLKKDNALLQDTILKKDDKISEKSQELIEVRNQYAQLDTFSKEQQKNIDILNAEKAQQELEIQKQENWLLKLVCVIGCGIVVIFFLFFLYRQKRKNNKILTEKNQTIEKQNHEIKDNLLIIKQQNEEISQNLKIIKQKNSDITDSLNYAGKIQGSLLKNFDKSACLMSDYFVFYLPKDIVSGDFYWGHKINNKLVFTVGDCTGHSVPGAFMSMLGIALLNQIVAQQHTLKASSILEQMRALVKLYLGQNGGEEETKDGMDMALCVLDMNTKELNYSGAYNPLYVVRNQVLTAYNATKCPVGIHAKELDFLEETIQIQEGDRLYMFSDGYSDQFGGPRLEKYKTSRFKKLLAETSTLPMARQCDKITNTYNEWKKEFVQIDDVCVVGIEI